MKYLIYSGNLEKLQKKASVIGRKCAKYGCTFICKETGQVEFRKVRVNHEEITVKYVEVEVEGRLQHNNWEFIAKVDHFPQGNVIRQFNTNIEVPDRYRHTDPICEHCNAKRSRKFTYLVHNTETDEWKQVGSSCLKEFTCGLDAEAVAKYIELHDYAEEGSTCYTGISYTPYYDIREYLRYANETIRHYGYVSTSSAYEAQDLNVISTRDRTNDFFYGLRASAIKSAAVQEEAKRIGFNPDTETNEQYVEAALNWIRNVSADETKSSYMFSLWLICSQEYMEPRNAGFVVSLLPTYYRHVKEIERKERQKREAELNPSRHQGAIGQRLTVKISDMQLMATNDSFYGLSYLYKFLDEAGNVFMWSTGTQLNLDAKYTTVVGTVKSHDSFRGVAQTFLTRCRVS